MTMKKLLDAAKEGTHPGCSDCPWNPGLVGDIPFGKSCCTHGLDWSSPTTAVSMQIVQDPAGTTPEDTGKLCAVCNKENKTDRTAQHSFDLWNAAIGQQKFKGHYWTNAIMHGASKKELRDNINMEMARRCCTTVLQDQINQLSPKVIIASGKVAANSLYDLGLLKERWGEFKKDFSQQAYREEVSLNPGSRTVIYCTYHTAGKVINQTVSKLYSDTVGTLLAERFKTLSNPLAAQAFLNKYNETSTTGKGMRVLLLHWLEIGEGIQRAWAEEKKGPNLFSSLQR